MVRRKVVGPPPAARFYAQRCALAGGSGSPRGSMNRGVLGPYRLAAMSTANPPSRGMVFGGAPELPGRRMVSEEPRTVCVVAQARR